jgi:hypothetical protein
VNATDRRRIDMLVDRFIEAGAAYEQAMATAVVNYARREAMAELLVTYAKTAGADAETMATLTALVADADDRTVH